MYIPSLGLGMSHFAVSRAIQELAATRDTFTAGDIADYIGACDATVHRCLRQMINAEVVKREGSTRKGWRYTCIKTDYNWQSLK